jgi:hypothetical protein
MEEADTQEAAAADLERHERQVRARLSEPPGLMASSAASSRAPLPLAPTLQTAVDSTADFMAAFRAAMGPRDRLPDRLYRQCQTEAEALAGRMRKVLKLKRAATHLEEEIAQLRANSIPKGMRATSLKFVVPEHATNVPAALCDHALSFANCSFEAAFAKLHVFTNYVHRSLNLAVCTAQMAELRPLLSFDGFKNRCEVLVGSHYDAVDVLQADLGIDIPRGAPLAVNLPVATAEVLFSSVCKTVASENEKEKSRVAAAASQRQKVLDDVNALTGRELLDLTIEEKLSSITKKPGFSAASPKPKAKPKSQPKSHPRVMYSSALDEMNAHGVVTSASIVDPVVSKGKGQPKGKAKGKGKANSSTSPPTPRGGKSGDVQKGKGKEKTREKDKDKAKVKESPMQKAKAKAAASQHRSQKTRSGSPTVFGRFRKN